ncbi:MAG TPA: chitobiase/beta-hexosaminidase C-terminal domain-containing protein [Erysipelothrix sp.]
MKNIAIANVYNFVRVSHVEPSRFIQDDYETIKQQIIANKQYKIPGSYALKYDAVLDPKYQALFKTYLDENDEISAWWEITEILCEKAGVEFPKNHQDEEMFDERVDSAYSIGYAPEDRKKLVDAYMEDFHEVFGYYPKIIGSWVLDEITLAYAQEKYNIIAAAICRDQMGTDGFTLWGGYPNGVYIPSKNNINTPANNTENAINIAMFRLLSPDPIYSFEADVRDDLFGVYTLEPSWVAGRGDRIDWYFDRITQEDHLGIAYTMVGQENNFLWENIQPGYLPQIKSIKERADKGEIYLQTMEESARYFLKKYQLTPAATFQATKDWDCNKNLQAVWYASRYYRLGFLFEDNRLRIRDMFVYRDAYTSRYKEAAMHSTKSMLDALPVLFPQLWKDDFGKRPFIRLVDESNHELQDSVSYATLENGDYKVTYDHLEQSIILTDETLRLQGHAALLFDYLPHVKSFTPSSLEMVYRDFNFTLTLQKGSFVKIDTTTFKIEPEEGEIIVNLLEAKAEAIYHPDYQEHQLDIEAMLKPDIKPFKDITIPLPSPSISPKSAVFQKGEKQTITMTAEGKIFYSLNESSYQEYEAPIVISNDTVLKAYVEKNGEQSEVVTQQYDFAIKNVKLTTKTHFDAREIFNRNGIEDLLVAQRGSLDYIDGYWLGTTENIVFNIDFKETTYVDDLSFGFLSAHRSGIVFPKAIEVYCDGDKSSKKQLTLPNNKQEREIVKKDFAIAIEKEVKQIAVKIIRHQRMPSWCIYKGDTNVFTMMDNLIIK